MGMRNTNFPSFLVRYQSCLCSALVGPAHTYENQCSGGNSQGVCIIYLELKIEINIAEDFIRHTMKGSSSKEFQKVVTAELFPGLRYTESPPTGHYWWYNTYCKNTSVTLSMLHSQTVWTYTVHTDFIPIGNLYSTFSPPVF